MILAVETSTKAFSISLYNKNKEAHCEILFNGTHSQEVVQSVQFLLARFHAKVGEIQKIYVDIGPGSFTGIRVGLSFVNTLAQVLQIPIAGVSSLDLLALGEGSKYREVIPFIKSRKNEVYTSYYRAGSRVEDFVVMKKEQFREFVQRFSPDALVGDPENLQEMFAKDAMLIRNLHVFHAYPRAKMLVKVALTLGIAPTKGYLKPLYIRGF